MASPQRYIKALENAGFMNIKLRDRNNWYRKLGREEYEQMRGPLYHKMVDMVGRENADRQVEVWRTMNIVLENGELRPGHLRAVKPSGHE